jgi:hypothetical protein
MHALVLQQMPGLWQHRATAAQTPRQATIGYCAHNQVNPPNCRQPSLYQGLPNSIMQLVQFANCYEAA